jgi:GNAT superfamily N-acetyltransferase
MASVQIAPVTPERWNDLVDLFTRRGPRGGGGAGEQCWCMWWRERGGSRERNRRAMRTLVKEGREPGLLAYEDGVPVGWVSVAPRVDFGHLMRSKHYGPDVDEDDAVWSIVCFIVHATARHGGVAKALLDAAVEHALSRGASAVEAYPHARTRDYMGSAEMFEAAGFRPVRRASVRTIVRYVPRHSGQSTSRPAARSPTQSRRRTPPTRKA